MVAIWKFPGVHHPTSFAQIISTLLAWDYLTPKKCGTPSPFRGLYPGWRTKMIIFPIHPQKNHGKSWDFLSKSWKIMKNHGISCQLLDFLVLKKYPAPRFEAKW